MLAALVDRLSGVARILGTLAENPVKNTERSPEKKIESPWLGVSRVSETIGKIFVENLRALAENSQNYGDYREFQLELTELSPILARALVALVENVERISPNSNTYPTIAPCTLELDVPLIFC